MKKPVAVIALACSVFAFSTTYAAGESGSAIGSGTSECPAEVKYRMDQPADPANLQFGAGTSDVTECAKYRNHVRVVINTSSKDVNGKGIQQQINNASNMTENYETNYGMEINKDFEIKVVVYGFAGKYLLNDAVFVAKFPAEAKLITEANGTTHMGSVTGKVVRDLMAKGLTVYMCQNTMKSNVWSTADLIAGVQQVPAGVTAAVDFSMQGYTLITP